MFAPHSDPAGPASAREAWRGARIRASTAAQSGCNSFTPNGFGQMLRLATLGELRLIGPAGELLRGRRKELVLLTYLARRAPRPVRRAELVDLLWGDRDEKRARHSLRQALLVLRRTVGEALTIGPDAVALASGVVELDLAAFEAAVAEGRYDEAVGLWGGDFLLDTEDAGGEAYRLWMEAEREHARRRLAKALEASIAAAAAAADRTSLLAWAERWTELLPLDERGHHRLVETLYLEGRPEAAQARYAEYVARLRRELDAEPSEAFVALGERIGRAQATAGVLPGSAALFSPDLVGRDAARAELRSAWNAVSAGGAAAIIVEGGEGMGKTRLCDEFIRSLEEQSESAFILQARAREEADGIPGSAARELFADIVAAPGLGGADDAHLAELSRLVPAIRERWPRLPKPRGDDRALCRAAVHVLAAVAHEVPVLVFLDDLGFADPATRQLVATIARQPPPGVLLLVTARTDRSGDARGVAEIPGVRRLKLPPLGVAEIEALVASMLELRGAERRALAERLHAETGGNPFYASEIVSAMVDEGHLTPDARGIWRIDSALLAGPLPLPSSVRDAIARRLDRLSDAARLVAARAAALGEPIDPARLGAESGLPPAIFRAALDELISRRLLNYARTPAGALESAHPLIRRAARERLSAAAAGIAPPRARRPRRRAVAAGIGAVLVLAGAGALLRRDAGREALPTLAVGHLETFAGADTVAPGAVLADMIATNLARVPGLAVVSNARMQEVAGQLGGTAGVQATLAEAARHAGAGALIEGAVRLQTSGLLRLELRRVDLRTGAVLGEYTADGADAFELADRATARLADALGLSASGLRIADVTTRSLAAYRLYADGLRSFGAADYDDALRLFDAALAVDSLFAMAASFAWSASQAAGKAVPIGWLERLDSLAARAPDRERLLIRAKVAGVLNDPAYFAFAETLATRYPAEPDGHLMVADARLLAGDFLAALPHLERVIAADSLGLRGIRGRCRGCEAFAGAASAYTFADSFQAAERVTREWIRIQPAAREAWRWLGVVLAGQGRYDEGVAALRTGAAASRPDLLAIATFYPVIVRIQGGDFAAADSVLLGIVREGPAEMRDEALWYLTISLRTQGRLREAMARAREYGTHQPPTNQGASLQAAQILFESGRFQEAAALFDSLAVFPAPGTVRGLLARHKSWMLAHLATTHAAAGDTIALQAVLEPLAGWGARSHYGRDRRLYHHANGLLLAARGQVEEAAAELRRAIFSPTLGYTRTNYELARTLLALGRPGEAVVVLEQALRGPLDASNLYITRTELHALLGRAHEAAGEPDSAAAHYRAVLAAWRNADPLFLARRDSIRMRLAALGRAARSGPTSSR